MTTTSDVQSRISRQGEELAILFSDPIHRENPEISLVHKWAELAGMELEEATKAVSQIIREIEEIHRQMDFGNTVAACKDREIAAELVAIPKIIKAKAR